MKKQITLFKRATFLLLALFMSSYCLLSAQPAADKVYCLVNHAYPGAALTENSNHGLVCSPKDTTNFNQLWLFETSDNGFTIRNANSMRYCNFQSTNETQFQTIATPVTWFPVNKSPYYAFSYAAVDNQTCMHSKGAAGNIVKWYSTANASQWTLIEVPVTKAQLQAQWDALRTTALANLSGEMTKSLALLNNMTDMTTNLIAPVVLQTTDAAAANYLSTNAQETSEGPIASLLDNNLSTFFHSQWSGTGPDADHYLQVDLGEGKSLNSFSFSYSKRNDNNRPTTMVLSGSNDGTTFTTFTTLTGLPTASNVTTYNSAVIDCGASYRYLRFTVTATNTASGKNNNHYYFSMSEFSLTGVTFTAKPGFQAKKAKLFTLYQAYLVAQPMNSTPDSYQTVLIQDAYSALHAAYVNVAPKNYPFKLTYDATSPYLYNLQSGRGASYWFTLTNDDKVHLNAYSLGEAKQLWYFKESDSGDLQVYPYDGSGQLLGTNNTSSGPGTVVKIADGTSGYTTTWVLDSIAAKGPYLLKPSSNTSTYLSNWGGPGNDMGFWTGSDAGSQFAIVSVRNCALSQLNNLNSNLGTDPGCYSSSSATFATTVASTVAALNSNTNTDVQVAALLAANAADIATATIVVPQAGKFYVLESANISGTYSLGAYAYVGADNSLTWKASSGSPVEGAAVWQFEANGSNYYLKNIHTGGYVSTVAASTQVKLGATQGTITVTGLGSKQFNITGSTLPLHAQQNYSHVVGWSAGLNSGSAWYIKEVSLFKQSVTITDAKFATLCLNYSVTVPTGVTAYYVSDVSNVGTGYANLTPVGSVIPAGVPVILNGEAGTYNFVYTTDVNPNAATIATANKMTGTLVNTMVEGVATNSYYVLGVNSGTAGLYKPTLDKDATGATGTTHFMNNANKAYMMIAGATPIKGFTFKIDGDDPTGVQLNTVNQKETSVYDLTGRRVEKVTSPGLYIVNGKKFYVK